MEKSSNHTSSIPADGLTENAEATLQSLRLRTWRFLEREGRRPRVLVATLQRQDGTHPAEQLGSLLAGIGFDVDLQPVLKPSDDLGRMAVENDVHALLVLGVDRSKQQILQDLARSLEASRSEDILLELDDAGSCDFLMQCTHHPVICFQDAGMDSVARLLDALERIQGAR
jgi:methylmalonyl-CoA mutase cobalamin-binding domain/chain